MATQILSPVYLVPEVAELLRTSEWSVYEMIKRDEVPGVIRIGNKIRISKRIFHEEMRLDDNLAKLDDPEAS